MSEFSTTSFTLARQPAYEGASQSYRLEQKGLKKGDQDTLAARELNNLWSRSHYLSRNNACAKTAKKRLIANWIGRGITVRWLNPNRTPNKKMQNLWDTWIQECNLDTYGNFYNTEDAWGSALFESGESLTRMVISKRKKSKIPLALQLIESEQLDPMFNKFLNSAEGVSQLTIPENQVVRNGIGFVDSIPTTYYFWKFHPGAVNSNFTNNIRIAIPADEIIHIFERERPGQWRGVPMLAAVLLNIYEMDELVDATLQRQKAAQAISWIISNTNMANALVTGTVRNSDDPNDIDSTTGKRKKIIQGSAGSVVYLNRGETITTSSIDDIGANLPILLADEWSKIASALGLAYHQLTGDLDKVNFSSIRAGLNELRVRVEIVQEHLFINLGLLKVTAKFQELAGIYESAAMLNTYATFSLPRRYGVDELKDAQADLMEVQAGFATLQSKLDERGAVYEEIVAEQAKIKASGMVLSSFPETIALAKPNVKTESAATATTANTATTKSDKTNIAKTRPSK